MQDHDVPIELSVLIPVGKRHGDIAELYAEYKLALEQLGKRYEVIFILDGPNRILADVLRRLQTEDENIVVLGLTRAFGESTALMAGFERARAPVLMTLPAYHQIQSADIPQLFGALSSYDLAVARRWPRAGGPWESLRRAAFHGLVSRVTGLRLGDLGCGARAFKRRVLEEISLYGDQHRFLAVLAHRQGFRVTEVLVHQSFADRSKGEYRVREYAHRALDILTVLFLVRFTKKPLRFFGMIGILTFGLGILLILYLLAQREFFGQPLADRPALLISSLLAVLGLQLFAIGLLGELIIFTHAHDVKDYQVDEIIQYPDLAAASLEGPDRSEQFPETSRIATPTGARTVSS
jgi:glycosyltransferase involved in cell wall biosynthesis